MAELRHGGRRAGKTSAMYDEMVRLMREYEEAAERDKLVLVCHPDERERVQRCLDEALARVWAPGKVELQASDLVAQGAVYAFRPNQLLDAALDPERWRL